MGKKSKAKAPKPSKHEIALAETAKKKFAIYKRLYRPLQTEMLKRSSATPAKINAAKGLVNADIQQGSSRRDSKIHAAGVGAGFQSGSNRVVLARGKNADAVASAQGVGASSATQAINARDRQGKINFIKVGHGVASQNLRTTAQLAQQATSRAIGAAQNKMDESNALSEAFGTAAGGYAAYKGAFKPEVPGASNVGFGIGRGVSPSDAVGTPF